MFHLPEYSFVKPDFMSAAKQHGWHIEHLRIDESWKENKGRGVKIAVLDSGFTPHQSIHNVKESISFVKQEDEKDYSNHGTGVIGILGGDCKVMCGICPESEIYSLKILNKYGSGSTMNLIEALDWCIQNPVDIINLSVASEEELGMQVLWRLQALRRKNVVIVVSSGNEAGEVGYPAKYESTFAIGAYGRSGQIGRFSNKGKEIDFAAPGIDIFTADNKNGFIYATGTSFAAPIFTGTIALLLHAYDFNSVWDLKRFLTLEVRDMGQEGKDKAFGWGSVVPLRYLDNKKPPVINSLYDESEEGEEEGEIDSQQVRSRFKMWWNSVWERMKKIFWCYD